MKLMSLKVVEFGYSNSTPLLKNINLLINESAIIEIVGVNGSGKTTLLHIIGGKLGTKKNKISRILFLKNTSLVVLPASHFLPDLFSLIGIDLQKSLFELNIELPSSLLTLEGNRVRINKLSNGQRRIVELLLILLYGSSKLILIDEPFNLLDDKSKLWLCNVFQKVCALNSRTIIYTSQTSSNFTYSTYYEQVNLS